MRFGFAPIYYIFLCLDLHFLFLYFNFNIFLFYRVGGYGGRG